MPYTFTVEDGTGLSAANSYVSVTEANDYLIQNNFVFPTWDAIESGDKQKVLSWASRYLDQKARWNGEKTVKESGLRWPRKGVEDVDGEEIPEDVIPIQLKQATIEMARYLLDSDRSADRGQDGLKEIQVDVIKLVFDNSYRLPEVPNEINNILRGLGVIISGPNSFAKIRRA